MDFIVVFPTFQKKKHPLTKNIFENFIDYFFWNFVLSLLWSFIRIAKRNFFPNSMTHARSFGRCHLAIDKYVRPHSAWRNVMEFARLVGCLVIFTQKHSWQPYNPKIFQDVIPFSKKDKRDVGIVLIQKNKSMNKRYNRSESVFY